MNARGFASGSLEDPVVVFPKQPASFCGLILRKPGGDVRSILGSFMTRHTDFRKTCMWFPTATAGWRTAHLDQVEWPCNNKC